MEDHSETLNSYQEKALKTYVVDKSMSLTYLTLGLTGEAGEVADKVKKHIRGDVERLDTEALAKEIGDVLWYVAVLSQEIGYNLGNIAEMNIQKLNSRQKNGKIKGDGDDR